MASAVTQFGADRYLAHSENDEGESEPLRLHLERVAGLASDYANAFGAEDWGRLAGLWHDLGKYSEEFQEYLQAASSDDAERSKCAHRVDHSTTGAKQAAQELSEPAARLLAYCIAGHHAGLTDAETDVDSCLNARLQKTVDSFDAAPAGLLDQATPVLPNMIWAKNGNERAFQASLFCRMVFSCLVDADYLATELHFSLDRSKQRIQRDHDMSAMEQAVLQHIRSIPNNRSSVSPVDPLRAEILSQCLDAADLTPGLFSLTVPTGGGKTLASLAMSLRHAHLHGLRRVIYAVPFTSIIEQNADVFREALGSIDRDLVLEHHSNFDPERETLQSRLACENWDAPIVVTTNVQFFESLFASRTSRCRKLHRIAGSVIVLDECQSIPVPLLAPCLAVLRELVRNYRCTVIMCTATRPALDYRDDFAIGLRSMREIIADPIGLSQRMQRVDVECAGPVTDAELCDEITALPQVLCIVNTRRHAFELAQAVAEESPVIHLSANMCPEHRSEVIGSIRKRLSQQEPCRVISTQLVEAGVDLDFPVVYRAMTGLDSIAQAAGRCNREGRLERGRVVVFEPENPIPRGELRRAADSGRELIPNCRDNLLSPKSVEAYFRLHYWKQRDEWDKHKVLPCFKPPGRNLDFRTAAERFRFIRDDQMAVIVPWGTKGNELVDRLRLPAPPDRSTRRRVQRFAVQIPRRIWVQLLGTRIELLHEFWSVLVDTELYHEDFGLRLPVDPLIVEPESLIV